MGDHRLANGCSMRRAPYKNELRTAGNLSLVGSRFALLRRERAHFGTTSLAPRRRPRDGEFLGGKLVLVRNLAVVPSSRRFAWGHLGQWGANGARTILPAVL